MRNENLLGERFGDLTVRERVPSVDRNRRWLCQCDCGNEVILTTRSLKRNRKSCGCRRGGRLDGTEALLRRKIRAYKNDAKERGYSVEITDDTFRALMQSNCEYCDVPANPYNGIDRVDNTGGYTIDNVVSCCAFCNIAKNSHSLEEFKQWVNNVYETLVLGDL